VHQSTFTPISKKNQDLLEKQPFFGNIVHNVLEKVVVQNEPLLYDQIEQEYIKSIEEYDPNNQISKEYISVGKVVLDEFYDQNSQPNIHVFGKEMGFNFIIGNYNLIGFIDRIDSYEDEVIIIDYKTR
jgi:RecB family exonuclease